MGGGARRLRDAASSGDLARVGWLLLRGHNPDRVNSRGTSALHCAAINGHLDVVKVLLEAGASPHLRRWINKSDPAATQTALMDACTMCWYRMAVIERLAAAGANPFFIAKTQLPESTPASEQGRFHFRQLSVHVLFGLRHWYRLQRRTWTLREHRAFPQPVREWVTTVMLCARRIADRAAMQDHLPVDAASALIRVENGEAAAVEPKSAIPGTSPSAPALSVPTSPTLRRLKDGADGAYSKEPVLPPPKVGLPPMPTEMWCMVLTMCSQAGMMPSPEIDPEWVHWAGVPEKEFTERFPFPMKPENPEYSVV